MTYVTKRSLFSLIAGVSIVGLIWYFNLIALGFLSAVGLILAVTFGLWVTPWQKLWKKSPPSNAPIGMPNRRSWRRDRNEPVLGTRVNILFSGKGKGFYLDPAVSYLFFGVLSLIVSYLLISLVMSLITLSNPAFYADDANRLLVALINLGLVVCALALLWMTTEKRICPNNHIIPLKIFGGLISIFIRTGDHYLPWPFRSNRDRPIGLINDTLEGDPAYAGVIWSAAVTVKLDNENGDPLMAAAALDRAEVKLLPTVTYILYDPLVRLAQNLPIRKLNEAAREAIRTAVNGLTASTQTNMLQSLISEIICGKRAYFVRVRRSDPDSGVHGGEMVIHDATRQPIFAISDRDDDPRIEAEVLAEVLKHGYDPMVLSASGRQEDGGIDRTKIEVTKVHFADKLANALRETGFRLGGLPQIGEITAPRSVIDAAGRAAAEGDERRAALTNAETAVMVGERLKTHGIDPATGALAEMAREIPGIRIIHQSGVHGKKPPAVIVDTK